ncbi:MAG: hypothetical protein Q9218_003808, partial [Villophora microphyllina]
MENTPSVAKAPPVKTSSQQDVSPGKVHTPTNGKYLVKSSTDPSVPKSSLTKPSPRPTSKASASRPQTSAALQIKERLSNTTTSSADGNPNSSSGAQKNDNENKILSRSGRARSSSPIKPTLNASAKRSSISSSVTSRKAVLTRNPSPVKKTTASANAATNARPSSATSRRGKGSTSSAAKPDWSTPTKAASGNLQTVRKRPTLGTRKSTMSVTIVQRLREMSLVHQMLRAAMAEDGDDDDEVKETYGKQMDENLAALKLRLEQAKNAEALNCSTVEPEGTVPSYEQKLRPEYLEGAGTAEKQDSTLNGLGALEIENKDLRESIRSLKSDWEKTLHEHSQITKANEQLRSATAGMERRHLEVQASLRKSIEDKDRDMERHAQSYRTLCTERDDLREAVDSLTSNWQKTLHEKNQLSQSNDKFKDREMESHLQSYQTMAIERDSLRETKQHEAEQLRQTIKSLEDRCQALKDSLKKEIDLHLEAAATFEQMVEAHESAKIDAVEEHKREIDFLSQRMHEMQSDKDRELDHQQDAIEALQDQVRDLNEAKLREIEETRRLLVQEHDEALSDLRVTLEGASQSTESKTKSELDETRATLGMIQSSNTELRRTLNDTKFQLTESRARAVSIQTQTQESLTVLRQLLDNTKQDYEFEASDMRGSLELLGSRIGDVANELVATRGKALALECERDEARDSLQTAREELQQLSDECEHLQRLDEQTGQAIQELSDAKAKLEEAIERVAVEHDVKVGQVRSDCLAGYEHDLLQLKQVHLADLEKAKEVSDERTTQQEDARNRVRELECALKVTTAELAEMQTHRCCSSAYTGSTVPKTGLRTSRWARKGSDDETDESDELVAGEELSSHIQGQMAGMREQLRQMEDMNEDLIHQEQ